DAVQLIEAGPVTQNVWDCFGNLKSTTDPLGNTTSYTYNHLNELVQETDPDPDGDGGGQSAPITKYTYNALGWLESMTDPNQNASVNSSTPTDQYRHDTAGRIIAVAHPADATQAGLTGDFGNFGQLDPTIDFPDAASFAAAGLGSVDNFHW